MEWIQDALHGTLKEMAPTIIMGIIGLVAVGMLLGSLKRMVVALGTAALNSGDAATTAVLKKPKAVIASLVMGCIIVPSIGIGYYHMPEKIRQVEVEKLVEKPVPYPVQDESEIKRLREIIDQNKTELTTMRGDKVDAETRVASLKDSLEAAKQTIDILNRQKEQAERKVVELTPKAPVGLEAELAEVEKAMKECEAGEKAATEKIAELEEQIDSAHQESIVNHGLFQKYDARVFKRFRDTVYHRDCNICEENRQISIKQADLRNNKKDFLNKRISLGSESAGIKLLITAKKLEKEKKEGAK